MTKSPLFIGIMSGTSLDGIDVVLATFELGACQVAATHFLTYEPNSKLALLALHTPSENELERSILLGNDLAVLYAQAVNTLLAKASIVPSEVIAIGCHGQTIRHKPRYKDNIGYTVQIGNASLLAELTGISVVSDFRSRDIAAGGQGAPLVPAFHQAIFANANINRAIINIGGIANITYLGSAGLGTVGLGITSQELNDGEILGFDSGPGNMLLDAWVKANLGKDYDAEGAWSSTGVVLQPLLTSMLAEPYFALPPPKSTGRDLFDDAWLAKHLQAQDFRSPSSSSPDSRSPDSRSPDPRPQDIARTLVALTAHTIVDVLMRYCNAVDEIYLCGGGARNSLLVADIQALLIDKKLATTDELGIGVDWLEALAFAWLAKQTIHNKPSNLPSVTGAKGLRVLGAIYPV